MKKLLTLIALVFAFSFISADVYSVETEKKVVLITGTASGMGKATAEHLIELGYVVYGGDIQHEKNKYLNKIGGHALKMDVTSQEQVDAGVTQIIKEQGRIDVLVNNAGFGLFGAVEDVTMEDARKQFDVNLFGLAMVTKAVLPHMRAQKNGRIVNISSIGGKVYFPLGAWYMATKHAVEGWSDSLRIEVKQFGIDVVVIEPGSIKTNFGGTMAGYLKKYAEGSAYKGMYDHMLSGGFNVLGGASEPIVIAKTIEEAITAEEPETRYAEGAGALKILHYRLTHGDKEYDEMITQGMFDK